MEEERRGPKVTFTFDYYEDREEMIQMLNYSEPYCKLHEIYNMVRSELKHGEEPMTQHIENLLERIKDEAWME